MFNLKNLFLLCLTLCCLVDVQAQCTGATQTNNDPYSTATCSPAQEPFMDISITPVVSTSGSNLCVKLNESITGGLLPDINQSSGRLEFSLTVKVKVVDENTGNTEFTDSEFFSYLGNGNTINEYHWEPNHPAYSATINLNTCSKQGGDYRVTVEITNILVLGTSLTNYCYGGSIRYVPVMNLNGGAYTISGGDPNSAINSFASVPYDELNGFYEDSNGNLFVSASNQCSGSPCNYIDDNPIVLHNTVVTAGPYFDINLTNNTSPLNFTVSTNGGVIKKYQVEENVVFTKGNCKIVPFALSTGTYIWGGSFSVTPSASANNIAVRAWNASNGCEVLYVYEKTGSTWAFKCEATFSSLKQSPIEEGASSLSVYPIPTQDYLNIEHSSAIQKIEVVDVSGRIIKSETLEASPSNYRLDVADLMNGIYFVRVQNELGNIYTRKFVR